MKRAMTIGAMLCCLAVGCGVSDDEGEPVSVVTSELRARGELTEPALDGAGVTVARDSSGGEGDGSTDRCQRVEDECIDSCNNSFPDNPAGWVQVAYRMCIDNCFAKGRACRDKQTALISSGAVNAVESPTVR